MRLIDADKMKAEIERRRKAAKTLTGVDMIMLIDAQPDPITRCCECQHWDKNCGWTSRMCDEWRRYTNQYEFCSRGKRNEADRR